MFFEAALKCTKNFEVRIDDRDAQVDDFLNLQEYHNGQYTGAEVIKVVTYKLEGGQYGIDKDYCVLGTRKLNNNDFNLIK